MKSWPSFLLLTFLSLPSIAAPPGVPAPLLACAQLHDDDKRLACYDREVARITEGARQSFGLNASQTRAAMPPETRDVPDPQISAAVVSVIPRSDGRNVITLSNGQIWVQGEAYEMMAIHAGDMITIKRGLFGSLHMVSAGGVETRVTRAK